MKKKERKKDFIKNQVNVNILIKLFFVRTLRAFSIPCASLSDLAIIYAISSTEQALELWCLKIEDVNR